MVIYEAQFPEIAARFEGEIRSRLPEVLWALQIAPFDIGSVELQLTSHNDSEYYKWHTDNGTPDTALRVVTFVYYFHAVPERFTGGQLVIHANDGIIVEAVNDSMVFFDSRIKHEVKVVACPSRRFEDGRFTLNGWVRRRVSTARRGYFDQKIFGPTARLPQRRGGPVLRQMQAADTGRDAAAPRRTSPPDTPRLGALVDFYAKLYHQSDPSAQVVVRSGISREDFYANFYFLNRPLVLKGIAADAPAVRLWSPEYLARRYGSVPVQITADRDRTADYEIHFRKTVRTITLTEFAARISNPTVGNDVYLVARNYFFDNPVLAALRDDLEPPPELINTTDRRPGTAKLWMGPKGTITPLHHDDHSIFFMQVLGRKHVRLISPFDFPRLYVRDRYYSEVDPDRVVLARHPLFAHVTMVDLEIEPGDALFIPAGWWHWVKSLDISISATFCSFQVAGGNVGLAEEQ